MVDAALVDLCGLRRNGNDVVPQSHVTDELKCVPEQIGREKEQCRVIAAADFCARLENDRRNPSPFQSKSASQPGQSAANDCNPFHLTSNSLKNPTIAIQH